MQHGDHVSHNKTRLVRTSLNYFACQLGLNCKTQHMSGTQNQKSLAKGIIIIGLFTYYLNSILYLTIVQVIILIP